MQRRDNAVTAKQNQYLANALVITRNLPPLIGGMERLIWNIVNELRQSYEIHVVGPEGCKSCLPKGVSASELPLRPVFLFFFYTMIVSIWHAILKQPAFVFAGSGLTVPFAWLASRICGARCIVYLHGLDIEARHPLYRIFWRPFFRRCDNILVNSHYSKMIALEAGVPSDRLSVIHPGVELADLNKAKSSRDDFRERHNLGNSPLMLFVGRITARKGLAVFVRDIMPGIINALPNAMLVVIGDEPKRAMLQESGECKKIRRILAQKRMHKNALFLGELDQNDPELTSAYFASDVLIFPLQKRENDNEGFGMVAIEAAAHSLPTVAFAVGGVADAVKAEVSGTLVPIGQNQLFAEAVVAWMNNKALDHSKKIANFAKGFSWTIFGERLRTICDD